MHDNRIYGESSGIYGNILESSCNIVTICVIVTNILKDCDIIAKNCDICAINRTIVKIICTNCEIIGKNHKITANIVAFHGVCAIILASIL